MEAQSGGETDGSHVSRARWSAGHHLGCARRWHPGSYLCVNLSWVSWSSLVPHLTCFMLCCSLSLWNFLAHSGQGLALGEESFTSFGNAHLLRSSHGTPVTDEEALKQGIRWLAQGHPTAWENRTLAKHNRAGSGAVIT